MTKREWFGTDGIRGQVGEAPITPDFVLKLGWAAGRVFSREGISRILIGKDTRISGYMFEAALESGMSAAGVDVLLTGPMPTPAIAYLTRTFRADAGVVISASHNPYHDNGVKFFSPDGGKLDDELELEIEAELRRPMEVVDGATLGKASRVPDAAGRYIEFCKSTVGPGFRIHGMKVVLDCAHGATYHVAPAVFRELGADVIAMGVDPDGLNINEHCGATSPEALARRVLEEQADLGIAFDGDGDRVVFVDRDGSVIDGDELLWIIARHRKRVGTLVGGVVGTQMSNLGLEQALAGEGIDFHRAAVGDRHVLADALARGWELGGESSGHILCLDLHSTGDGIVAALQVILALEDLEIDLREARAGFDRCPQKLVNVRARDPGSVMEVPGVRQAVADAEHALGEDGRVLLRPSGTEPLVRVMVEARDEALVDEHVGSLAERVEQAIAAR